tara:strand:+ start:1101 stop:1298 length:198 start_codon:yes stop_codon:yes gene_type:complete
MPFLGVQPSRGLVASSGIQADAVTGAKIADDTINSEHYVAESIDHEHVSLVSAISTTGKSIVFGF